MIEVTGVSGVEYGSGNDTKKVTLIIREWLWRKLVDSRTSGSCPSMWRDSKDVQRWASETALGGAGNRPLRQPLRAKGGLERRRRRDAKLW